MPAPVGPTSAMRSPSAICSDTSCSTGSFWPYANVTWSTSTAPERGRSIAACRWRTVGRVSRTPKILLKRRGRRLHGVVELTQLVDRLEQAVEPQHERGDGADRHDATRREPAAVADDHRGADHARVLDDREVLRRDANGLHVRFVLVFVRALELAHERVFAAERLHHAHAFEALLQRGQVRRDAVADLEIRAGSTRAGTSGCRSRQAARSRGCRARAATTRSSTIVTAPTNTNVFCTNEHEALRDELLHRVDVGGHAGDDLARLLASRSSRARGSSCGRTAGCAGRAGTLHRCARRRRSRCARGRSRRTPTMR